MQLEICLPKLWLTATYLLKRPYLQPAASNCWNVWTELQHPIATMASPAVADTGYHWGWVYQGAKAAGCICNLDAGFKYEEANVVILALKAPMQLQTWLGEGGNMLWFGKQLGENLRNWDAVLRDWEEEKKNSLEKHMYDPSMTHYSRSGLQLD